MLVLTLCTAAISYTRLRTGFIFTRFIFLLGRNSYPNCSSYPKCCPMTTSTNWDIRKTALAWTTSSCHRGLLHPRSLSGSIEWYVFYVSCRVGLDIFTYCLITVTSFIRNILFDTSHVFRSFWSQALESEFVSCQLHQWIDLIFGYKQRGGCTIANQTIISPPTTPSDEHVGFYHY